MLHKTKSTKAHNGGTRKPSKCEKNDGNHVWETHPDPYYSDIKGFNVYRCENCHKVEWENKKLLNEKYDHVRP